MSGQGISFLIFGMVGGLAIFIYGMQLAGEGLEKIAGGHLRAILGLLTRNRFLGVVIGFLVTVATQSSSATTVMLVSFADAALMELKQALGVILGAGVGTTLTVQLIAFKITDYAPLIIALGFLLTLIKKGRKTERFGRALLGFGFIFLGMGIISSASSPLKSSPYFTPGRETLPGTIPGHRLHRHYPVECGHLSPDHCFGCPGIIDSSGSYPDHPRGKYRHYGHGSPGQPGKLPGRKTGSLGPSSLQGGGGHYLPAFPFPFC